MKAMMRVFGALASVLAMGCTTDPEPARRKSTVYDSFGPGMTFQNNMGWSISGKASDNIVDGKAWVAEQAFSFPGKTGTLTDVWVSLGYWPDGRKPGTITFSIEEDENGLPGRTLESWQVTGGFHPYDSTVAPIHMAGNGTTALVEGKTYWLRGTADDSSAVAWDFTPDHTRTCKNTTRRSDRIWDEVGNVTCSVFRIDAEH